MIIAGQPMSFASSFPFHLRDSQQSVSPFQPSRAFNCLPLPPDLSVETRTDWYGLGCIFRSVRVVRVLDFIIPCGKCDLAEQS